MEEPLTELTKAQTYALRRLQGLDSLEAARSAGYTHGRPTMDALELHEKACLIIRHDLARQTVEEQLEEYRRLSAEMTAYLRAFDVMDAYRAEI